MIELALVLSVVFNCVLLFYAIRIARRLLVVASNMDSIMEVMTVFKEHVEQVHEAEMFYGDQTLQALIQHSKDVIETLQEHEDLMQMVSIEEEGDAEEEED